jgi:hypothetical protein
MRTALGVAAGVLMLGGFALALWAEDHGRPRLSVAARVAATAGVLLAGAYVWLDAMR